MTLFEKAGALLGWGAMALIVAFQTVDVRRGLFMPRDDIFSVDLAIYLGITVVCLPWTIRELRRLTRQGRMILISFLVFIGYGLISVVVLPAPMILGLTAGRLYSAMPLIMGTLAMLTALSLIAAMPARFRFAQLWWSSAAVVVACYLGWVTRLPAKITSRFWSGMGGAAIIYVVLLVTLGVFLAAAYQGYRRWMSIVGAVACIAAILLSGSRAALICLTLFVVAATVRNSRYLGRISRRTWRILGGIVSAAAIVVVLNPATRRVLSLGDDLRETNLASCLRAWAESWYTMAFGHGAGQIWPWYVFESGLISKMPRLVNTQWGDVLPHSHSTFLFALAELGIVGLAVFVVFCVLILKAVPKLGQGQGATAIVLIAVLSAIPGFLFDTYLIRNYPVSWWWWFVLISVAGFNSAAKPATETDNQVGQESAAKAAS